MPNQAACAVRQEWPLSVNQFPGFWSFEGPVFVCRRYLLPGPKLPIMCGQLPERLAPPADLRPAQLGIILVGRVIAGHIGATLIDLSRRGFLRIEEVADDDSPQWLLTDLRDQGPDPDEPLLPFEMILLGRLFGPQAQVPLPGIGGQLIPALNRVRTELRRDAG